jgi:hypothetical protein
VGNENGKLLVGDKNDLGLFLEYVHHEPFMKFMWASL